MSVDKDDQLTQILMELVLDQSNPEENEDELYLSEREEDAIIKARNKILDLFH